MALTDFIDVIDDLRSDLGGEDESLIKLVPTGIDIYDIFSGGGLPTGGFVEFAGNPGSGKTTLALQILGQIQKRDPNSIIVIIDAERSMTPQRLKSFGLDPKKIILIQKGVTVEKIFEVRLKKLFEKKDQKKIKDVPTYVLWDSIAQTPAEKELEVADLNQAIGVKAKVLNTMIRKYDELLLEYNTTMIAINQLTSKVAMGNIYAKQVDIPGLGDRVCPGGTGHYYAAFHFLLLDRKQKLTGSEFGFKGYILQGTFIKNKAGVPFEEFLLVVDYKNGVDQFWTKFIYLKEAKILKVNGGWYTLEGYTDESGKLKKFRGSQSKEKYETDEQFRKLFDEYWNKLAEKMKELITNQEKAEELTNKAEEKVKEQEEESA